MGKKGSTLSVIQGVVTAVTIVGSIVSSIIGPKLEDERISKAVQEKLDELTAKEE